jgi:hypothetical protein
MRQKLSFFVFMPNGSWPSSSGLKGRRRTYYTILKLADHALYKMVRYVLDPVTSEAGARRPRSIWHEHKKGQFLSHDSDS